MLLGMVPTLVGALAGVSLIGIGVGGTNPPLLAFLGDISPENDIGKIGGVYNTFGDIGSAIGPVAALPLATVIGYQSEYFLSMGLVLITLISVIHYLIIKSSEAIETSSTQTD
jgi:MFS family permease